ncbi:MAG TPA: alanine dehydrogenase [Candidatus Kryptonia bacterium]
MNIGIPNESSKHENRVALTPSAVATLTQLGHPVYVESQAGIASRFTDEMYRHSGGTIAYAKEEIFRRCELVCGVEPPTPEEVELMEPGKTSLSFVNLPVARPQFIEAILQNRINTIGAELIESDDGDRPVIHSMSEIAGQLSIFIAARCLQSGDLGRGIILGGIAGVAPAAVVILGAGVVGTEAARTAAGLGAQVIVLDRDLARLREVDRLLSKRVSTALATPVNVKKSAAYADVLIGAVFTKGERTPHIVTEEMVKSMKPGAVIIDVSIDQGGCVETSRPTTIENPTFLAYDVIHYCVPNITATVARTATYSLTNTTLHYIIEIAQKGIVRALKENRSLGRAVCSFGGKCTQKLITEIFGGKYLPIESLLS